MKKLFIYTSLVAVALGFSACNEDFDDWASPQTNPQESAEATVSGGTIEAAESEIVLNAVPSEGVALVNFVSAQGMTEGSSVRFTKLLLNDNVEVPFMTKGNQLMATADALSEALKESYNSMAYTTRNAKFKVEAVIVNADGVAVPLPIETNEVTIDITTFDELPIISTETAFYYVGGYNGWNLGSPTPMEANGDGTYSCIIELGAGSEWFCFAPQSAVDAQDWNRLFRANTNGDTSTSGFFNLDITSGNSFCAEIPSDGKYKFTISPKDWTYTYGPYTEMLYYAGDSNGWGFSPLAKVGDNFVGYYYIYQPDNSATWGFKLTTDPSWDNPQYGAGEGDNTIALGGGNIQIAEPSGFYQLSVNTDANTYSLMAISQMSLIGSAIGTEAWSTDYDLTFNTETMSWEGTYQVADGEFKIRANHDWSLSWGGSLDAMTSQNGANLSIEAGTYKFSFKPNCDGQGVLTIEAQ